MVLFGVLVWFGLVLKNSHVTLYWITRLMVCLLRTAVAGWPFADRDRVRALFYYKQTLLPIHEPEPMLSPIKTHFVGIPSKAEFHPLLLGDCMERALCSQHSSALCRLASENMSLLGKQLVPFWGFVPLYLECFHSSVDTKTCSIYTKL